MTADVAPFRDAQRRLPRRPFVPLAAAPGDRGATGPIVERAERILSNGWRIHGGPPVTFTPPIAWMGEGGTRSWWYNLNALDLFLQPLRAHDRTGDDRFLRPLVDVALDWCAQHPSVESPNPFAWYDMAVGLRAYRLAYVLDEASRDDRYDDDVIVRLLDACVRHADVLADDEAFAGHSNHGVFQAAGQLALAARFPSVPELARGGEQAVERLTSLFDRQFTDEGVHREHSPAYHRMVLATFRSLVRTGLFERPALVERLAQAADALGWFIDPDGRLVPLGDATSRAVLPRARKNPAELPEGVRAFPQSGYFVVRRGTPVSDPSTRTHVVLNAAFHSRTHKHADDLSFVWFDRGRELLVDAGTFGYLGKVEQGSPLWAEGFWYSHPDRVFVESTRAHNTVEIDGRSHPRRVEPYGSGLTRWTTVGSVSAVEARVRHGDVEHERLLVLDPGRWLLVVDRLRDVVGAKHDLAQRFQWAPDVEVCELAGGNGFRADAGDAGPVHAVALAGAARTEHGRGRGGPDRLGWVSPEIGEIVPTSSIAFAADGVVAHRFATLFAFGDEPPQPGASNRSSSSWSWSWSTEGCETVVRVGDRDGPLAIEVQKGAL